MIGRRWHENDITRSRRQAGYRLPWPELLFGKVRGTPPSNQQSDPQGRQEKTA
jgi:hypothetical protein